MSRFIQVICLLVFMMPYHVFSQDVVEKDAASSQQMIDVIYLKDGTIIRGKIVDRTDDYLIVQQDDGSISTYQTDNVVATLQEEVAQEKVPGGADPVDEKNGTGALRVEDYAFEEVADFDFSDLSERDRDYYLEKFKRKAAFKIGGGAVLSPDTGPVIVQSATELFFNPGQYSLVLEGKFLYHSESVFESSVTTLRYGMNAIVSTRNPASHRFYLFAGVGFALTSVTFDADDIGVDEYADSEDLNYVAGAGYDISNVSYIEAQWDHVFADILVTAGFRF